MGELNQQLLIPSKVNNRNTKEQGKKKYISYAVMLELIIARSAWYGSKHPYEMDKIMGMIKNGESLETTSLWQEVVKKTPAMLNYSECILCKRGMEIKTYHLDATFVRFIIKCGEIVKRQLDNGEPIDKAYMVDIHTSEFPRTMNKACTRAEYWGLMQKADSKLAKGTGYWVINKKLFDVLAGEKIPKYKEYWNGRFHQDSDDLVSLFDMKNEYNDRIQRAAKKRGNVKSKRMDNEINYNPSEWYTFAGYASQWRS